MDLTLRPIGIIRTPFTDRYAAPRQPGAEPLSAEGTIELDSGCNFEAALSDLAGFERIWLLFWFHRNQTWKPKVLPPRTTDDRKRGVFATRSPHRPNPLGLSLVRLLEVKRRTLRVADVDILDGTPLLDIKPYLPGTEAFPNAKAGWVDELVKSPTAPPIAWSELAVAQAQWLDFNFRIPLRAAAEQALSRGLDPHPYRRISALCDGTRELAWKAWRIHFKVAPSGVTITRVLSGYPLAELEDALKREVLLPDLDAHLTFYTEWPQP